VEPAPVVHDAPAAKAAATSADAQVAAPAPTAVETAAPAAGNLPPPPAPRAADSITRLPAGGAVYFAALPEEIGVAGGAVSEAAQEAMRDLGRVLNGRSAEKLFEDASIDARGTILGALLSPSEKSARAVIDGLVAGASGKALEKLRADHEGDAIRARLLVPLRQGADPVKAAATLAKAFIGAGSVEACPGGASCGAFGAEAPLQLVRNPQAVAALYADGTDLRVDIVMPIFTKASDKVTLPVLVALRGLRGGPAGRCSRFDPGATLSVCVDGAQAGELGATTGYAKVAMALEGDNIVPKQRIEIATVGRTESQRNLTFGSPSRKLASDGTLVLHTKGNHPGATMTWALGDAARPGLEKAFAAERCAAGKAATEDLLPALIKAVGDPGKEFTDPKKVYEDFREAGWGAFPIALSGTWLNQLGVLTTLKSKVRELPASIQVCLHTEGGRLGLAVKPAP
jgi:hypothetical protein